MLQQTREFIHFSKLLVLFSLNKYSDVKLLDHMVVLFLIFWWTQTVFHSGCSNIYSPHSALGFPFLHIQANTCFCFLIIGILTGVRRYLFVCVFFFISLMINYVGQLFMYLLALCIFSLENENLYPFPIFQLIFFMFSCMSSLCILDTNLLSDLVFFIKSVAF